MSKIHYTMDNPEARAIMEQFTLEDHRQRLADQERSRLRPISDFTGEVIELHNKTKEDRGLALPWMHCRDIILEPNRISIVGGANGHMKSTITTQLALQIARQTPVAIMSLEIDMVTQAEILCQQIYAESKLSDSQINSAAQWAEGKVWLYSWMQRIKIQQALGFLWAASDLGCGLAIIDNLQKLGIGHNDNDAQNEAFEHHGRQTTTHLHVVLVHHVAKPPGNDPNWRPSRYSLRGSSGLSDKTDNIFMAFHNKKRVAASFKSNDERDEEDRRLISEEFDFELIIEKLRNQPGERTEGLYHGPRTLQMRAGGTDVRCIYD